MTELRFDVPADGLPAAKDWLGVLESMLLTGIDVQREPLSVNEAQPVNGISHCAG